MLGALPGGLVLLVVLVVVIATWFLLQKEQLHRPVWIVRAAVWLCCCCCSGEVLLNPPGSASLGVSYGKSSTRYPAAGHTSRCCRHEAAQAERAVGQER